MRQAALLHAPVTSKRMLRVLRVHRLDQCILMPATILEATGDMPIKTNSANPTNSNHHMVSGGIRLK
jgi:hypothetical protein